MKLILPGRIVPAQAPDDPQLSQFITIRPIQTQELEGATRAGRVIEEHELAGAADDDIVELEYESGVKEWISVGQLKDDLHLLPGQRGGAGDVLRLPTVPIHGASERSIFGTALKILKVFGVDPVEPIAAAGAQAIVGHFEAKLDPAPGLYRLSDFRVPATVRIASSDEFDASGPALVFIHGTASSLMGSFGGQRKDGTPDGLADPDAWSALRALYGERIYGLQHKTLSESPVENALALARLLPSGARLHVVTHSRGGLVGELLCLQQLEEADLAAFRERAGEFDRAAEITRLRELADLLSAKGIQVERFVRVACPARGTILASRRVDRYLSIIGNLMERIPILAENPIAALFKATLFALIKQRADPRRIPGLEAQMPESPLIHLLNRPGLKTKSDLGVIAGDIEGSGFFGHLKVFATDLFYLEDHDLVVNTESMYGGMGRDQARFFFDQGPGVNHFGYFRNPLTRSKLVSWLSQPAGKITDPDFQPIVRGLAPGAAAGPGVPGAVSDLLEIPRVRDRELKLPPTRAATPHPLLFVLPGIMGSHLEDGAGHVWMNMDAIMQGGMARLEFGKKGIRATNLMAENYERLCQYLASGYEVIPFPYDWRDSVEASAEALRKRIAAEKTDRPIRLLAHSMGGLVARAMITNHPDLWAKLLARGGRLVMLGTPNGGSYVIPRLLFGADETLRMLDQADAVHTAAQLSAIIAGFPGVLEMLPARNGVDFFQHDWWAGLSQAAVPGRELLAAAATVRGKLAGSPTSAGMVYVAGASPATLSGIDLTPGGTPVWTATTQGDGTVPYALGRIAGVPVYYMDAEHGDLANHPPAFPAITELLEKGETSLLPREEPMNARGVSAAPPVRDDAPMLFPTEIELLRSATRSRKRRQAAAGEPLPPLRIAVAHGELRWARNPVLVGHYEGDGIVSAEKELDRRLKRRLSKRFQIGAYPGPAGSSELVIAPGCTPPGAIIVGLGAVGEITREKLRRTVAAGALRYALAVAEETLCPVPDVWRSAALSALLIGTGGGNSLSVADAVTAIIDGVLEANRVLRAENLWGQVRIDALQFVELYEDAAVQAISAAHLLARRPEARTAETQPLVVERFLTTLEGGRAQQPANQYQAGWWRRLLIAGIENSEDLKFTVLTDRARAEARVQCNEDALMKGYLEAVTQSPAYDERTALTLFELLIPNELKRNPAEQADNLLLVVDERTAQYPWEYLAQRSEKTVEPLATRLGILRQFVSSQPKPLGRLPWGNNALVVGDTESGFNPLPGATDEAEAVAQALRGGNYVVTDLFKPRPKPHAVISELFARDYKIIHIAAHGEYDEAHPRHSGVVLGPDLRLNACQFEKLPSLPELVFINCCHLAKIGDQSRLRTASPNRLSASVAKSLIDIGVKAVIAAGWAVNDTAARTFARTFYEEMIAGQTLGEAVREARRRTYLQHGGTNTWAAYQCYGNPDFRLYLRAAEEGDGFSPLDQFFSRSEFIAEARRIRSEAPRATDDKRRAKLVERLDELAAILPGAWRDGATVAAFGMAWDALGAFRRAIGAYQEAIKINRTEAPLHAIERLANLEDRYATKISLGEAAAGEEESSPQELWKRSIGRYQALIALGETVERLTGLGAVYKRQSDTGTLTILERKKLLRAARDAYGRAHQRALKTTGQIDPYPAENWLALRYLLGEKIDPADVQALREAAAGLAKHGQEIWSLMAEPDALLVEALINGDLDKRLKDLKTAYQRVLDLGIHTAGNLDSMTAQLSFMERTIAALGRAPAPIRSSLGELKTFLTEAARNA
ncbi:MAG: hypothetical protein QOE70_6789 [Chthoniobacter sp.]|jgi:CHAT domain-containing protein/pimeloyl-ACP methyl ester carboxylesterase|nr:hypothetical protein [Chthoniobacter sp.]